MLSHKSIVSGLEDITHVGAAAGITHHRDSLLDALDVDFEKPLRPSAHGSVVDPTQQHEPASAEAERPRGARGGDLIGGRYVVEGQLGRGGMGRVLRVRHSALGKPFALKVIKSAISTNPRIRELFYREARLASALTHDNICSIVDFGEDKAFGLFMVMEILEGQTVHARLRHSGRFSPKVACDVMWQVADAMPRALHTLSATAHRGEGEQHMADLVEVR
jgi:hypothetical protein